MHSASMMVSQYLIIVGLKDHHRSLTGITGCNIARHQSYTSIQPVFSSEDVLTTCSCITQVRKLSREKVLDQEYSWHTPVRPNNVIILCVLCINQHVGARMRYMYSCAPSRIGWGASRGLDRSLVVHTRLLN